MSEIPKKLGAHLSRVSPKRLNMPGVIVATTVAGLSLVALLIWLGLHWISSERNQTLSEVRSANINRASIFAKNVEHQADMAAAFAGHVVDQLGRFPTQTRVAAQTVVNNELVATGGQIFGVYIETDRRALKSSSINELSSDALLRIRQYVSGDQSRLHMVPPIRMSDGQTIIGIVPKSTGENLVVVFLTPEQLLGFAASVEFQRGELISLIGLDGITRARRTGGVISAGEDLTNTLVMRKQMQAPNGTYTGPNSITGEPYVFSHRRLTRLGVFATSGMPYAVVSARIWQTQRAGLVLLAVSIFAVTLGFAALTWHLLKRSRQVRELRIANKRMNDAQRLSQSGDWTYNCTTHQIDFSNSLIELYGLRGKKSLQLVELHELFGADQFSRFHKLIQDTVDSGLAQTAQFQINDAGGSLTHRRIRTNCVVRPGGAKAVLGLDQCIDNEVALENAKSLLAGHDRLDSMNFLSATLAHELAQPLSAVSNYISATLNRTQSREALSAVEIEYLKAADQQVQEIGELINSARELVGNRFAPNVTFEIGELIKDAIAALDFSGFNRTPKVIAETNQPFMVKASRTLIKQAIQNLIKNACEAVPENDRAIVKVTTRSESDWVKVFVFDNGTGFIDAENPFTVSRTSKHTGLGLGLALARTIIESFEGKIWIERSGQDGSVVGFSLPLAN